MITCHRIVVFSTSLRQLRPSCVQLTCGYASKPPGNELEKVQNKTKLDAKNGTKSGLKVQDAKENNEIMEPTRDNRIMVQKSIFDINNMLPNNWITWAKEKKDNYFYPPATVVFAKDGVSRARYTICYRAENSRLYIGWAAAMTPIALLGAIGIVIWTLTVDRSNDPDYDPLDFDNKFSVQMVYAMACLYHLLIWQFIVKRKVIRIYYNKDKKDFVVVWFNPWCPFWIRKLRCKAGEAKLLTKSRFPFTNTEINGKRFFIGADNFSFSAYFNVLYGYENPRDIEKLIATDNNVRADNHFKAKKHSFRSNIYDIKK